jgi:hypothetical protein
MAGKNPVHKMADEAGGSQPSKVGPLGLILLACPGERQLFFVYLLRAQLTCDQSMSTAAAVGHRFLKTVPQE